MQATEPMLERVTRAMASITTDHEYIHEGGFFEACHKFTLAAAATGVLTFITPAVKYVHYRKEKITSSGDKVTIEFFEAPTVTAETGTPITPVNHNRLSAHTAGLVIRHGATVTADGTPLCASYIGGGTGVGSSVSGADTSDANEWVLKRNTAYMVRITNGSAAQNIIQVNPVWYEEASA